VTNDESQQQLTQVAQAVAMAMTQPGAEVKVLSPADKAALHSKAEALRAQADRLEQGV
jgi:uncharacterized protein YgfB (UPF0149 family)